MSTEKKPEDPRRAVYTCEKDKYLTIDAQVHIYDEIPEPAQEKQIEELKTWLVEQELYKEHDFFAKRMNDLQLMRFLRARDFDMNKAKTMISEYLVWMVANKPHEIRFKDVQPHSLTGKVSIRGNDRFGRPVMVLHNEYENMGTDYPNMVKHMIWNLERATRILDEKQPYDGVSRYVVILNMSNFSYSSQPPMAVSNEVAKALGDNFPERLGLVVILNAPWLFRGFYTLMTAILNQRTKSKIHFVKEGEYKDKLPFLLGDNWEFLTGLNQPQVDPKVAPGFKPDEWVAQCLAEDAQRFPQDAEEKKNVDDKAEPVDPTSPSVVIIDEKDCQP